MSNLELSSETLKISKISKILFDSSQNINEIKDSLLNLAKLFEKFLIFC
jgi:hypothetical protein